MDGSRCEGDPGNTVEIVQDEEYERRQAENDNANWITRCTSWRMEELGGWMCFSAKEPPNHNRGEKIDPDNCEISRIGREGGQQARLYSTGRQSRIDVWEILGHRTGCI
jgi:hypothetical protein